MLSANSAFPHIGYVGLPNHEGSGGFDHAACHAETGHVYVAHTANSAVDVFDPASRRHLFSVAKLPGVAGVPVSDSPTHHYSNRAENTVAIFPPVPTRVSKATLASVPTASPTITVGVRFSSPTSAMPLYPVRTLYPLSVSMIVRCGPRSPYPGERDGRSMTLTRSPFTSTLLNPPRSSS